MKRLLPFLIAFIIFQNFIAPMFGSFSYIILIIFMVFVFPRMLAQIQSNPKQPPTFNIPGQTTVNNPRTSVEDWNPNENWNPNAQSDSNKPVFNIPGQTTVNNPKTSVEDWNPNENWDPNAKNDSNKPVTVDPTRSELFSQNNQTKSVVSKTLPITLVLPPKKQREDDALMFLSEGEEVVLIATGSRNRPVAVYDRSKHLIGYLPPAIGVKMVRFLDANRVQFAKVESVNERFNNKVIKISIEIKQ